MWVCAVRFVSDARAGCASLRCGVRGVRAGRLRLHRTGPAPVRVGAHPARHEAHAGALRIVCPRRFLVAHDLSDPGQTLSPFVGHGARRPTETAMNQALLNLSAHDTAAEAPLAHATGRAGT